MPFTKTNEFEALYKEHYPELRRLAQQMIGDTDDSHDVVQDVFIKLWPKRDALHTIADKKAYLCRSVLNASISYLEKNKTRFTPVDLKIHQAGAEHDPYSQKELESQIEKVINGLPPKCKAIFVLSRFENLPNKDIANIFNLSLKTVENHMGIAIKKLRSALAAYLR